MFSKQDLIPNSMCNKCLTLWFTVCFELDYILTNLLQSLSHYFILQTCLKRSITTILCPLAAFWIIIFLLLLRLKKASYSSSVRFSKRWGFFLSNLKYDKPKSFMLLFKCISASSSSFLSSFKHRYTATEMGEDDSQI